MKHLLLFGIILATIFGCKPKELTTENLINKLDFSAKTVPADGTSQITVSAYLNPEIDTDKRTVVFTTSAGNYVDGKDGKISKTAEFVNDQLVATVQLKAPTSPTTLTVTAEMAYAEIRKDYIAKDTINAMVSLPDTLMLSANAFSVLNNYEGEITITGRVLNKFRKAASKGLEVDFTDTYVNNTIVGGRFRPVPKQTTDDNSQVSVTYSPGAVSDKTDIYINATVKNYPNLKSQLLIRVRQSK